MIKIVFIIEQLFGGGAERVTSELANEICKKEEYEVHMITFVHEPAREYMLDRRVVRHNINFNSNVKVKRLIGKCIEIRKTICEISPTYIISLAMTKTIAMISFALIGAKTNLILSERNDPSRYKNNFILRLIRHISFLKSDGVVFQTEQAKNYFSDSIKKKSTVIYNPINNSLPDRYQGNRKDVIVNFCSLTKQKNLDLLIDSFFAISKEFPSIKLYIYGEGPEREHLEEKVKELNLQNRVFLPGYSIDIYEKVKMAKVFISSSNYEGMSNSMLEALCLGVPTICTDCPCGGAKEIIKNGINGFLVPVNNQAELVKMMRYLLQNDEIAKKISDEGYKIRKKLTTEEIASQWIGFINNTRKD